MSVWSPPVKRFLRILGHLLVGVAAGTFTTMDLTAQAHGATGTAFEFDAGMTDGNEDGSGGWRSDGARWTPNGRVGGGLSLDGEAAAELTAPAGDGLTVSAWLRPEAAQNGQVLLSAQTSADSGWTLYSHGSSGAPQVVISGPRGAEDTLEAPYGLPIGRWSHLAVSIERDRVALWVNGRRVDGARARRRQAPVALRLGAPQKGVPGFRGVIDGLRFTDGPVAPNPAARSVNASGVSLLAAGGAGASTFDQDVSWAGWAALPYGMHRVEALVGRTRVHAGPAFGAAMVWSITMSPAGDKIAWIEEVGPGDGGVERRSAFDGERRLMFRDLRTGSQRILLSGRWDGPYFSSPQFDPRGEAVIYGADDGLRRLDLASGGSSLIGGIQSDFGQVSPSGQWLATNGLAIARADGSSSVGLGVDGTFPNWSPDGASLVYRDETCGLSIVDVDGTNPRQLTTGCDTPAGWTADGTIFFTRFDGTGFGDELYAVPASGGAPSLVQGPIYRPWVDGWFTGLGLTAAGARVNSTFNRRFGDEEVVAHRFRPLLRFDSGEPWRPLDVERFFDETFSDGHEAPRHRLCPGIAAPGNCRTWESSATPSDMLSEDPNASVDPSTMPYIDIHGEGDDVDSFESPRLPSCPHGDLNDCDSGANTALYYRVSGPYPEANFRFVDYWAFYRYNKFQIGDLEADWENVVVALPSTADPQDFRWVALSQHGTNFRYLRAALHCDNVVSAPSCGTDDAPNGSDRVVVFPANGSHANYANRCDAPFGAATCARAGASVGEKGHDGERPWGANSEASALKPLPAWARWSGWWGIKDGDSHVRSPGQQPHFDRPFDVVCTELGTDDDVNCPLNRRTSTSSEQCEAWNGPGVAVTACDPTVLEEAMQTGTLGERQTRTAESSGVAAATRGVTQILGAPLREGGALEFRVPVNRATRVLVRTTDESGDVRRAVFRPGSAQGTDRLRVTSAPDGGVELELKSTGRRLRAEGRPTR